MGFAARLRPTVSRRRGSLCASRNDRATTRALGQAMLIRGSGALSLMDRKPRQRVPPRQTAVGPVGGSRAMSWHAPGLETGNRPGGEIDGAISFSVRGRRAKAARAIDTRRPTEGVRRRARTSVFPLGASAPPARLAHALGRRLVRAARDQSRENAMWLWGALTHRPDEMTVASSGRSAAPAKDSEAAALLASLAEAASPRLRLYANAPS